MAAAGKWLGVALTFLGAVLFSTKAVVVKLAFREVHIDAISLLALRMLFALPFYLIAAWWATGTEKLALSSREWCIVIALGLFGYYLSSLFDFLGLQFISAGLERLILFLYPSFTALINFFYFKQPLEKRQRWALVLTYIGLAIAYYGEVQIDSGNKNFLLGSALIFCCSITYATYMAGAGRMIPKVGVTRFTAFCMLASTLGVFVHYAFVHGASGIHLTAQMWKYGLVLGVIATVLPSFLISSGMKRIGSNNAAIVSGIGPVSTIIQANLFLGEQMHAGQFIGTVLVVSGVLLIGWKSSPAG